MCFEVNMSTFYFSFKDLTNHRHSQKHNPKSADHPWCFTVSVGTTQTSEPGPAPWAVEHIYSVTYRNQGVRTWQEKVGTDKEWQALKTYRFSSLPWKTQGVCLLKAQSHTHTRTHVHIVHRHTHANTHTHTNTCTHTHCHTHAWSYTFHMFSIVFTWLGSWHTSVHSGSRSHLFIEYHAPVTWYPWHSGRQRECICWIGHASLICRRKIARLGERSVSD